MRVDAHLLFLCTSHADMMLYTYKTSVPHVKEKYSKLRLDMIASGEEQNGVDDMGVAKRKASAPRDIARGARSV
jgi:hypothetical protein